MLLGFFVFIFSTPNPLIYPASRSHTRTLKESRAVAPTLCNPPKKKKRKGCDPDWFFFVSRWEANALPHLSTTAHFRACRQTLCVTLFGGILWCLPFRGKQNFLSCEKNYCKLHKTSSCKAVQICFLLHSRSAQHSLNRAHKQGALSGRNPSAEKKMHSNYRASKFPTS